MARRRLTGVVLACLASCAGAAIEAQQASSPLVVRIGGELAVPVLGDEEVFDPGYGASAVVEVEPGGWLSPFARATALTLPVQGADPISVVQGAFGAALRFDIQERFFARAEISGGVYNARWGESGAGGLAAGARAEAGIRLGPALRLSGSAGVFRLFQVDGALYTGFGAGVDLSLALAGLDPNATHLRPQAIRVDPVFPVFYSYYGDHAFGELELRNEESFSAREVEVSLFVPAYMSRPTVCASFERIDSDASVRVPITALFNERILTLTERSDARGELVVTYRLLGAKREVRREVDLSVQHRNAMTWNDDRKAAAFVSANDPAVLWFSRFVNAVVRDRFRSGIDRNLQQAVGIFEALKLFGLAYVVDPASSYVASAADADVVDYLQYPHQTLFYRGGDCDDLSILYAALLQSVGIETVFITVPGHIYLAFAAAGSPQEIESDAYDPALYIFRDGKAWIPVEVTMVKDGFVKAWRVGAKQWVDNERTGTAGFFRMSDNWKSYPSVGIPEVNPRFLLPDEARTMQAFDLALDRHVAREIDPLVKRIRNEENGRLSPEALNRIGLVYARYGMLNEAWESFSSSAKEGYLPAWTNLANVAFIKKDFMLALDYYRYAIGHADFDPAAAIGIARSAYELERFEEAATAFDQAIEMDDAYAVRYSYVASTFGGQGRAWSLAERADSVEWVTAPRSRPDAILAVPPVSAEPSAVVVSDPPASTFAPRIAATAPLDADVAERIADREVAPPPESPEAAAAAPLPAVPSVPSVPAAVEVAVTAPKPVPIAAPHIAASAPIDADIAERIADREVSPPPEPPEAAAAAPQPPAAPAAPATVEVAPPAAEVATAAPPPTPVPEIVVAAPKQAPTAALPAEPLPEAAAAAPQPPAAPAAPATVEVAPVALVAPPAAEVATAAPPPTPVPEIVAAAPKQAPTAALPAEPLPEAAAAAPQTTEEFAGGAGRSLLSEGFADFRVGMGDWNIREASATQTNRQELFAKIAAELPISDGPIKISFSARSNGNGWVGFGLHLRVEGSRTLKGYGAGRSILVWFTSDPRAYPDNPERVQLYRSENDIDMRLLVDEPLPFTLNEHRSYALVSDPSAGTIRVTASGRECLSAIIEDFSSKGTTVIFRALDAAEFLDFSVERIPMTNKGN